MRGLLIPNLFAYVALCIWPVITAAMFAQLRLGMAVACSVIAGFLLLPVAVTIAIPVLVDIDKTMVISVSTFLCAFAFAPRSTKFVPRNAALLVLFAVFVLSPIATSMLNHDPQVFTSRVVSGMNLYDGFSVAQGQLVLLMPFMAGYAALRGEKGHRTLLMCIAVAGLIYTLPMLLEIRLSPQLNRWVYGFFPHSFGQQYRGGSFRPVVFVGHGLMVAIVMCMAVIAMAGLTRYRRRLFDVPTGLLLAYLGVLLYLCRSLGSLLISGIAVPLAMFAKPSQVRVFGFVIALLMIGYPVLRHADLIPAGGLQGIVQSFNPDRAQSLQVRTENEGLLLNKAVQRPLFGWGTWGRNRVYSEGWGSDISVTDGYWIMTLGSYGYIGYFATFGILCFGLLARPIRGRGKIPPATAALQLVMIANLVDLLPNASLSPLTWLIAGALCPAIAPRRRDESGGDDSADLGRIESAEPDHAPDRAIERVSA